MESVLNEIYKVLTPNGTFISVSYGFPANRESYFKSGGWNWRLSWEKVAKPTISASVGVTKEEGQDQKNFHFIYIMKKQAVAEVKKDESKDAPAEGN